MKVDSDRIKAITDMKEPNSQKELLKILGVISYVVTFIPNVSELIISLWPLIKIEGTTCLIIIYAKAYEELETSTK